MEKMKRSAYEWKATNDWSQQLDVFRSSMDVANFNEGRRQFDTGSFSDQANAMANAESNSINRYKANIDASALGAKGQLVAAKDNNAKAVALWTELLGKGYDKATAWQALKSAYGNTVDFGTPEWIRMAGSSWKASGDTGYSLFE
jgi:hypothetical protein